MKVDSDKKIQLYAGDLKTGKIEIEFLKNEIGNNFSIAEFDRMSYEELLQRCYQNAFERNPNYFEEDKVTCFLFWYDDYLIEMGNFDWGYNEKFEKNLFLSHFFYTKMTKYKEVLHETVFERDVRVCIVKTTRPIIKKIVEQLKKHET